MVVTPAADKIRGTVASGPMPPHERFFAWIVTGPAGHLAAGLADFGLLFWRYWSARLRGRSLSD